MSPVSGPRKAGRDANVPRRLDTCRLHGWTEFARYRYANGNGSPGWRCMRCRAEAVARANAKRKAQR